MAKQTFLKRLGRDLVSDERRDYKMRLGSVIASSLFGILCGVVISSIVWFIAFGYATQMVQTVCGN